MFFLVRASVGLWKSGDSGGNREWGGVLMGGVNGGNESELGIIGDAEFIIGTVSSSNVKLGGVSRLCCGE